MEVVINAWAELNLHEAYRVLKPEGYLIQLGAIPNALCRELTPELVSDYAWLPKECAPAEIFEAGYPDSYLTADNSTWNGIRVDGPIHIHQFTCVADYLYYSIAGDMAGWLYGPKSKC